MLLCEQKSVVCCRRPIYYSVGKCTHGSPIFFFSAATAAAASMPPPSEFHQNSIRSEGSSISQTVIWSISGVSIGTLRLLTGVFPFSSFFSMDASSWPSGTRNVITVLAFAELNATHWENETETNIQPSDPWYILEKKAVLCFVCPVICYATILIYPVYSFPSSRLVWLEVGGGCMAATGTQLTESCCCKKNEGLLNSTRTSPHLSVSGCALFHYYFVTQPPGKIHSLESCRGSNTCAMGNRNQSMDQVLCTIDAL